MRWLSYLGVRYGLALVLALIVAGFVLTVKALGPDTATVGSVPSLAERDTTTQVPAAEPHLEGGDLTPSRAPAEPSTSPGAAPPAVVATTFARAWLRHTGVSAEKWLLGLRPYATQTLLTKLKDTDPATVPADRLTGDPVPGNFSGQSFVEYRIAVDSGNLVLRLTAEGGQWRVDTVDWERTL